MANIVIDSRTAAHIQPTTTWGNIAGTITNQPDLNDALQSIQKRFKYQSSDIRRNSKSCLLSIRDRNLLLIAPHETIENESEKALVFARYVRTSIRNVETKAHIKQAGWITPLVPTSFGVDKGTKYFSIIPMQVGETESACIYSLRFVSELFSLDTEDAADFLGIIQEKSLVEAKESTNGGIVQKHLQLINKKLGIGIVSPNEGNTLIGDFMPFTVKFNNEYGKFYLSRWTDNCYQGAGTNSLSALLTDTQSAQIHKAVAAMDLSKYTLKSDSTEK